MNLNIALASYPGYDVFQAMEIATKAADVSLGEVQICPQNRGELTPDVVRALRDRHPDTRFRLHANVRVPGWSALADASSFDAYPEYFSAVKALNAALGNPPYTLHAGARRNASLERLFDNVRRIEDFMGCPVGVEGMYPRKNDRPGDCYYLLASAEEYAALLASGVRYAVDLSHLNIVHCREGVDPGLVRELVASERCIEVHVSGNDGLTDSHAMTRGDEWWWPLLEHVNPQAVIFTEENRRQVILVGWDRVRAEVDRYGRGETHANWAPARVAVRCRDLTAVVVARRAQRLAEVLERSGKRQVASTSRL